MDAGVSETVDIAMNWILQEAIENEVILCPKIGKDFAGIAIVGLWRTF